MFEALTAYLIISGICFHSHRIGMNESNEAFGLTLSGKVHAVSAISFVTSDKKKASAFLYSFEFGDKLKWGAYAGFTDGYELMQIVELPFIAIEYKSIRAELGLIPSGFTNHFVFTGMLKIKL